MLSLLILAGAMTLVAQDVPQTAPAAQDGPIVVEGQQKARDKRVCKRSISTGSIMAKVTCKTAGEWEIERDRQIALAERRRMSGAMETENRRINTDERLPAPK